MCLFPDNNNVLWATHFKGDDYYLADGPDETPATDENGNVFIEHIAKNQDYWSGRLLPFVKWIEYYDKEAYEACLTRGMNDVPDFEKLTFNMNNGAKRYEINFPFTLYHQIDKGASSDPDNLYENGSVSMRFEVMPICYSSWYHWRGTTCFKSNRKDWDVDFVNDSTLFKNQTVDFSRSGWAGCTFSVPAPDRSTWGIISLKNASSYTMRNVKIYAKGKENQAPVTEIPDTYASQERATTAVLEDTYTVTFEFINPDNNQVVNRGVLNDVKVKMGKTLDAATTSLSTGNADMEKRNACQR